jgi:hypothetical protein
VISYILVPSYPTRASLQIKPKFTSDKPLFNVSSPTSLLALDEALRPPAQITGPASDVTVFLTKLELSMAKFAIGDKVDRAADDRESGVVVAIFSTDDGIFRYAVDMEGYGALQFLTEEKLVVHLC